MVNASTIVTVDLIDETTVIVGPILAMIIGIDVITAATIAAMTDATTTVAMTDVTTTIAMTATKGVTTTGVIVTMIAMMIVAMTDVTTDAATTTIISNTATGKSGHLHHHPKGATPMAHSRRPTVRSTSSSEVAKRSKATDIHDQTPGRLDTSTPKTYNLCGGLNSQSLSPGKIIGFTSPTSGLTRWSSTPYSMVPSCLRPSLTEAAA
jgi:hypothetical protein